MHSHVKETGMLVVSFRGANHGFGLRLLGYSGRNANAFSCRGIFRAEHEEMKKKNLCISTVLVV